MTQTGIYIMHTWYVVSWATRRRYQRQQEQHLDMVVLCSGWIMYAVRVLKIVYLTVIFLDGDTEHHAAHNTQWQELSALALVRIMNADMYFSSRQQCSLLLPTAATYGLRLAGGRNHSGRVEIQYQGVWGTVCDDGWDINDATVVCRQLGFSTVTSAHSSHRVSGMGHIWMDDVRCTGSESRLQDCSSQPFGHHSCYHSQDAGVTCL